MLKTFKNYWRRKIIFSGIITFCLLLVTGCGDNPTVSNQSQLAPTASAVPNTNGPVQTQPSQPGTATATSPSTSNSPSAALTTVAPSPAPAATTAVSAGVSTTGTLPVTASVSITPETKQALFDHVFIIVLENADYSQAVAQPYLKKLAAQGALLSNYSGVAHPSYPNYLALIAGSTFGITSDSQVNLDQTTVLDLMAKKGISWKFYAEQYPANRCFTGVQAGNYVRKHLPALSLVEIQKNPALCDLVVPAAQLKQDLASGNQPAYSFYVPDLKNDGHDTGVAYASNWLEKFMNDPSLNSNSSKGTLFVVTFDESESPTNNKIYTVFLGSSVKPGSTSDLAYNHYNLLRTIEDNFQLGSLGREDARANPVTGVWLNGN